MGVKELRYRGMTIKAGSFQVATTGRFIVSLSIARVGMGASRRTKLFEPPSEDGFFDDPCEGVESALAFGRAIVDGEIPGLTVEDL